MRGGQITIFVALGLVILLTVGFIMYVILQSTETGQSGDIIGFSNANILNNVLGSCLETVVNDELLILGETGALPSQEGFPSAITSIGTDQRRVLYGITKNRGGGILPRAHDLPRYPDWGVSFDNATINPATGEQWPSFVDGYFGDVNFPAVCSKSGNNKPAGPLACKHYPGNPPSDITLLAKSTQETLEEHIERRVQACANPDILSEAIGLEVTEVFEPLVNVTFTPSSVVVDLRYKLALRGTGEKITEPFSQTYPVRYLSMAQYAIDLARQDTRDIRFHIAEDHEQVRSYKEGFSVQKISDVAHSDEMPQSVEFANKADLVIITDSYSNINGESYKFYFLIEHRLPMLDIVDTEWEAWSGSDPVGMDPDDGEVSVYHEDFTTLYAKDLLDGDIDSQPYPQT